MCGCSGPAKQARVRRIAMRPATGGGYGPWMVSTDDDMGALRPISIRDGVVTRPASAWSATVHAFLRYLRSQELTCVLEPLSIEGDVERLVAIDGDAGADGWAHQHSEAGPRSAARPLRKVHDASVGWDPPQGSFSARLRWHPDPDRVVSRRCRSLERGVARRRGRRSDRLGLSASRVPSR